MDTVFTPSGAWPDDEGWDDAMFWLDGGKSPELLPSNAGRAELAVEQTVAAALQFPIRIADLWNPDTCPPAFLPWLAHALSVDDWDSDWSVEVKRAVIRASIGVHRRKGSVGSIKTALAAAGFGSVEVIERFGWNDYDGTRLHDGSITYATRDHWAEYRLRVAQPLSAAQSAQLIAIIRSVAPARSHLAEVAFYQAAHTYNGAITHDGSHRYGEP